MGQQLTKQIIGDDAAVAGSSNTQESNGRDAWPLFCTLMLSFFTALTTELTMTNWTIRLFCLTATLLCAGVAQAQAVPLDDGQLGEVWGQALLELNNATVDGKDFSRITLNADISLSANFKEMRLGQYAAANNGTGADIDIKALQFGRNPLVLPPGGDQQLDRVVRITNPYFEFVYSGGADAANRQVVGMRMGFEGASGYLGTQIRSLSGSVNAAIINADGSVGTPLNVTGSRTDAAGVLPTIGQFQLGNADGPTRDFFIGVQSQAVAYTAVGGISAPTAAAGFWLNMRDRVTGTIGDMPANQLRPAAAVKW